MEICAIFPVFRDGTRDNSFFFFVYRSSSKWKQFVFQHPEHRSEWLLFCNLLRKLFILWLLCSSSLSRGEKWLLKMWKWAFHVFLHTHNFHLSVKFVAENLWQQIFFRSLSIVQNLIIISRPKICTVLFIKRKFIHKRKIKIQFAKVPTEVNKTLIFHLCIIKITCFFYPKN